MPWGDFVKILQKLCIFQNKILYLPNKSQQGENIKIKLSMGKYINLLADWAFKRVFGSEDSKECLIAAPIL